jgi:hypothetical protein
MKIGTRIHIPDTRVEGTVVDVRGRFIGIHINGSSSTHYMTPETFETWKVVSEKDYVTPETSPDKTLKCPPAPKKVACIKPSDALVRPRTARKLVF